KHGHGEKLRRSCRFTKPRFVARVHHELRALVHKLSKEIGEETFPANRRAERDATDLEQCELIARHDVPPRSSDRCRPSNQATQRGIFAEWHKHHFSVFAGELSVR